ncbi:2-oxoacid:acceptor oxidoreductase subunit alpha [Thermodesulfobacteriota bacterium]
MKDHRVNIVIGGEAGQGLATVGRLLASMLVRSGYHVFAWQEFESRIRGGHNTFAVCASSEPIWSPREPVDMLVALNEETVALHRQDLSEEAVVIRGGKESQETSSRFLDVPLDELASGRFLNSVALGVVAGTLGLEQQVVHAAVERFFGEGKAEAVKDNQKSITKGMEWVRERKPSFQFSAPARDKGTRAILNGHEALVLGALSAGLKFYSFYPMSPSTSIAVELVRWAKDMGVVLEQCEDEIAVLNMALGASYAGAPSMVGTSGGGFALMTEAVSLAGVSETPVVIVVAQRPGPGTGLATRTAQADLELVLHGGHGEFPRVIFAPGTVDECFDVTRKAFETAGKIRGPVIVLTDQFLADGYWDIEPFDLSGLDPVVWGEAPLDATAEFLSYRITETGVSPRLFPGLGTRLGSPYEGEQLVICDSHEHTEDGHITEDRFVTKRMVEKRLRKDSVIRKHLLPLDPEGDSEPDLLIVSWGSSKGAVSAAADALRSRGERVAHLHLLQVWPLPGEELLGHLESANRVVCVEGNATGQLAGLIRRETGFAIERKILQYDGRPLMPEWILRELDSMERGSEEW